MAYDDRDALFVDPRPPRPEPPQPPPDTLQAVPNSNPETTTCSTCGRAVMAAHVDADGNCSVCVATPVPAPAPISGPAEVEEGK